MARSTASQRLAARPCSPPREWAVFIFGTRSLRRLLPLAAIATAACSRGGRPAAAVAQSAIRIVDDAGDTISLPRPARRVVSLVPATTELLFAIGAGGQTVGRTTWCDYPPAAAAVPNLGDGISPNVEAVLARRPDLVLLYHSGRNAEVAARLRALGVAAAQFNTDHLADVERIGRLLGTLTGHERSADSLGRAFRGELARSGAHDSSRSGKRPPAVLLLVWGQPPMTVGRGSFLSELVERAGARNVFADVAASSATVSLEAVTARDPDVILSTIEGPSPVADAAGWRSLRAVRAGRSLRVRGSQFGRPSPRAAAAVRELAAELERVAQ